MTTIHAEITAGRERIVLVAGGLDAYDVADAARRLKALTPLFSKSDPPGALTVPLTWPAVVQLANTFGPAWRPGPALQRWVLEETARRTTPAEPLYPGELPAHLTPYPWQVAGAALIAATGKALITDEPGTGKTITTILGLVERFSSMAQDGPCLVVCPASVVDAWVEAWRTWAPHVRAVAWMGPKRQALAGTADVYVTSYETARIDSPVAGTQAMRPLEALRPAAVVVDECHYIRNQHAARSKAVRRLAKGAAQSGGAVVGLSGTPITKHTGNIWAFLNAMEPDAFPSSERWNNRYLETVQGDYDVEVLGLNPHTEPEFRLSLLGQHRRISKADALPFLPDKVYSVRTVELPAAWRKAYDDFEAQMYAELPAADDGPDGQPQELAVMDVMSVFGHLSRLASAAADVEITFGPDLDERTGEPKRHVHLELKAPSWKVDALLEILAERNGEQVVCFADSRQLVVLAGEAAAAQGLRVGYIVGGQARGGRTRTIEAFQAGQLDLVCVTTKAGGTGITLTAARTVVFLQRPWSLDESIQAEDRCHRIGSEIHDSIEVIDVVAKNTLEARVRAVLRQRAGQLAQLVQDPRLVAELLGGTSVSRRDANPLNPPGSRDDTSQNHANHHLVTERSKYLPDNPNTERKAS